MRVEERNGTNLSERKSEHTLEWLTDRFKDSVREWDRAPKGSNNPIEHPGGNAEVEERGDTSLDERDSRPSLEKLRKLFEDSLRESDLVPKTSDDPIEHPGGDAEVEEQDQRIDQFLEVADDARDTDTEVQASGEDQLLEFLEGVDDARDTDTEVQASGEDQLLEFLEGVDDARDAEIVDGMKETFNRQYYDSLAGKSGKEIVDSMEKRGGLIFEGEHADRLRQDLAANLDNSPFFKQMFLHGFGTNPDLRIHYIVKQDPGQPRGMKYGIEGSSTDIGVQVTPGFLDKPDTFRHYLAHETFHAASGLTDSADMEQAMAIFETETGKFDTVSSDNGGKSGNQYDYDLFRATRADWNSAGALRQQDYYDYSTPEMKDAMERIYGPEGRDRDPTRAFSDSCQTYDNDVNKIAQAYLDAKDGGEVEKIRAEQLRELGIEPEVVKDRENNLNSLAVDYYESMTRDDFALMKDRKVPWSAEMGATFAELVRYDQQMNPGRSLDDSIDSVMKQVQDRVENAFRDRSPKLLNSLKPFSADRANDIISGWFNRHGGQDSIADAYHNLYG